MTKRLWCDCEQWFLMALLAYSRIPEIAKPNILPTFDSNRKNKDNCYIELWEDFELGRFDFAEFVLIHPEYSKYFWVERELMGFTSHKEAERIAEIFNKQGALTIDTSCINSIDRFEGDKETLVTRWLVGEESPEMFQAFKFFLDHTPDLETSGVVVPVREA